MRVVIGIFLILVTWSGWVEAEELTGFDLQVRQWAEECRKEVVDQFEYLLREKILTPAQLFDTFYVPIPNTEPQKFHTQYDLYADKLLQNILDRYLQKNKRLVFVVVVDANGYLPTHNSRYSLPLTGNADKDVKMNRTKRIFNDRTGLAAARNKDPYFLQRYSRDTGEQMADLSVPIFIQNRHWGAVRFGYVLNEATLSLSQSADF